MKTREPRRKVVIPARMRADGAWVDVCIRNISTRGLLLQGAEPPERGTYVEILGPAQTIVGRVAWRKDRRFGIRTQDRLDLDAMLGAAAPGADRGGCSATSTGAARGNPDCKAPTPMATLERSRQIAATVQFALLIALGATAAILAFGGVRHAMSRPFEVISRYLGSG